MPTIDPPCVPPLADSPCAPARARFFYVVAPSKFVILFVATFGFYFPYWSCRNWRRYRDTTGIKVIPWLRAVLNDLFIYSLVMKIDRQVQRLAEPPRWHPRLLALAIILTALGGSIQVWVPDNLLGLAAGLGVFVLQTYWLLCVQKAINAVEGDPQGQANARLSGLNRLWVALGGCVWLLTLGSVALELR